MSRCLTPQLWPARRIFEKAIENEKCISLRGSTLILVYLHFKNKYHTFTSLIRPMINIHQSKKWKPFNDCCIFWRLTAAFTGPAVFGRPPPAQHNTTVAKTACSLNDRSANIVTQIDTVGLSCQSPLRLFEASHLRLGVGESKVYYWSWPACYKS